MLEKQQHRGESHEYLFNMFVILIFYSYCAVMHQFPPRIVTTIAREIIATKKPKKNVYKKWVLIQ